MLDPDDGFVVTANQAVTDRDYPYHLSDEDDWDHGYRAQRIRRAIEDEGELSVTEMTEMQLDDRNAIAPTLVPYLLDVEIAGSYYSAGQELLRTGTSPSPPTAPPRRTSTWSGATCSS